MKKWVEKANTTSKKVEEADKTSKKIEKNTTWEKSEIENSTETKAEFFFLFLTKRRKNTNIETLKQLAIIFTVLTRSYFSTDDIAEIIDELSKAERRILTQISETFTKLCKYRKVLSLVRDFHFHDRENSDSNDLDFLFRRLNESLWQRREKSRNLVFHEDFRTNRQTFSLFFIHDERRKNELSFDN